MTDATRLRRVARLAGSMVGVGAALALAGCSGTDEPGGQDATASTTPGQATQRDGDAGATPTATPTRSPADCERQAEELAAELDAIRNRRADAEAGLAAARDTLDGLEERWQRWEPFPEEIVATAESVGVAAREGVVKLHVGESGMDGQATGWYVDDHHVVTNAHNVTAGEPVDGAITVWTLDGEERSTTLVDYDEDLAPDVAILRTEEPAPRILPTGSSADLVAGDPLVQVGHPGGVGNWLVSLGTFERRSVFLTEDDTEIEDLSTSVPGRQGISGSPILTLDGEVVGLTYAGQDLDTRLPTEQPSPGPAVVYDRAIAPRTTGSHVPVETVLELYERWT